MILKKLLNEKTIGILLAALVIYFVAGIRIDFVTLPVVGMIDLRWFVYH